MVENTEEAELDSDLVRTGPSVQADHHNELEDKKYLYNVLRSVRKIVASFIVATAIVWLWLLHLTGSFPALVAFLRGYNIFTPPSVVVDGDGVNAANIEVVNLSRRAVNLNGYKVSCPCVSISNLPFTLQPWQRKEIPVTAASVVNKDVRVLLNTDVAGQNDLSVIVQIVAKKLR